jgi:pilus assembly protein CpaC
MKKGLYTYTLVLWAGLMVMAAPAMADRVVTVEINKGAMIKLDRPVSSVVIADPNTADVQVVSPKLLFVQGKKVGETSLYAVDGNDDTVFSAVVEVTFNVSKLESTIKRVAPNADVGFRTVDGGLVLEGFASSPEESANISSVASAFLGSGDKMVNMVTTGGSDQVTLQVKIVEMARTDAKRFGINMQNIINTGGGLSLQLLQGADIETVGGIIDRGGSTDTALFASWAGGRMNNLIEAMEDQGLVNVLAEPTLTTTSGKAASFLAGGEFPIPVSTGDGNISVQYKPFGVSLNFTPIVMSKDRISIAVAPEVSTISFDNPIEIEGIRNPILNTRKANATVELGSGQTFALAGLLKSDHSNTINKFPGLGDVPVLGTLFRSREFQNNQTELVILVTPYIVRPVSDHKLQTPVDGFVPPSDFQSLLLGNLYQQEPMPMEDRKLEPALPKLHGDGGFILE